MVQDVASDIQVGAVPDVDTPAVAQGGDQGLPDHGHLLPIGIFDLHRILDGEQPLLDPAQRVPCHIQEHICFADAQDLAVHPEYSLAAFIFDPEIIPNRDQVFTHLITVRHVLFLSINPRN